MRQRDPLCLPFVRMKFALLMTTGFVSPADIAQAGAVWNVRPGDQFSVIWTVERQTDLRPTDGDPVQTRAVESYRMDYSVMSVQPTETVFRVGVVDLTDVQQTVTAPNRRSKHFRLQIAVAEDGTVNEVLGSDDLIGQLSGAEPSLKRILSAACSEQAVRSWVGRPFWLTPRRHSAGRGADIDSDSKSKAQADAEPTNDDPSANRDSQSPEDTERQENPNGRDTVEWTRLDAVSLGLLGEVRGVVTCQSKPSAASGNVFVTGRYRYASAIPLSAARDEQSSPTADENQSKPSADADTTNSQMVFKHCDVDEVMFSGQGRYETEAAEEPEDVPPAEESAELPGSPKSPSPFPRPTRVPEPPRRPWFDSLQLTWDITGTVTIESGLQEQKVRFHQQDVHTLQLSPDYRMNAQRMFSVPFPQ
ncbi:MAG: hypothetical protein KDA89_15175 [Planctomycetaceae bacterium]|nr:hypothetical protein [Planctomycetaceae bacterium]